MVGAKACGYWLTAGIVVICAGHFLTSLSPGIWTWGLDYWSGVPFWARFAALALVFVAAVPQIGQRLADSLERALRARGVRAMAWIFALTLFLAFRSRGHSYGDGYSFRGVIGIDGFPALHGNLTLMTGDIAIHWLVHRLAVAPLGGNVEVTYAILSALGGVFALAAIVQMGRSLFHKTQSARFLLVAAGFSSGLAVMWFGYVEAYTLMAAAVLWMIVFLIQGQRGLAWGVWLAACVLHLSAAALLPVLVWDLWGENIQWQWTRRRIVLFLFVGFVGAGLLGTLASRFLPGIFVPFFASADTSYTAFSVAHLSDMANLLLFAAPLGVIGAIIWTWHGTRQQPGPEVRAVGLLAIASASLLYFAFWIDPLLGAFRDWDLIGLFGIPFSILGALLIMRVGIGHAASRSFVLVAAFALGHTGLFVAGLQSETAAMERVDRLIRQDPHYSRNFYRGERLLSWAYILTHIHGRQDLALGHLRNRVDWEPTDHMSWGNLGSAYWFLNQRDSAAACFERSNALSPNNAKTLEQLAVTYSALQQADKARVAFEALAGQRELTISELNTLAFCHFSIGRGASGDSILEVSLGRQPTQHEPHYYRGLFAESAFDTTAAIAHYAAAASIGTAPEDVFVRWARLLNGLHRWDESARVADAWASRFPSSPEAPLVAGICRIATREYDVARRSLERSLSIDSANAVANYYLATAYRNLGQVDAAKSAALRAAQLDPSLHLPYLELLYIAADAGDRAGALAATREYLRRAPGDSGMPYLQQFLEP